MKFYPSFESAKNILNGEEYKNIPICTKIKSDKKAVEICNILKNISNNVFILESCEDAKNWGRYSFLGFDPSLEFTCKNGNVSINSSVKIDFEKQSPHEFIRKIIKENKSPYIEGLPSFTGGLVGYFAYDFIKYSEPKLKFDSCDEDFFNDVDLMLFNKIIVVDNFNNDLILIVNIKTNNLETNFNKAKMELKSLCDLIEVGVQKQNQEGKLLEPLNALFDENKFCKMVEKAKEHIYEGDIFQVVLSNRLSAKYQGSLFGVYENLRKINPSPYMFYFCSNEIELAGASPETLVKVQNKIATTFPLAGTRKRGKSDEEDLALQKDLLSDEKECAEHNMLVDLGRNDIGKISKFGSVKVEDYMNIVKFSHVMHIGSTVSGELKDDKDCLDALDSILPAGTLSGAPKLKACEIIDKLEGVRRGVYGGAIGYIDFTGNMDTCIAIRLAYKKNDKIFVRSGAGIVSDSIAKNEYEETINKARAVVEAIKDGK